MIDACAYASLAAGDSPADLLLNAVSGRFSRGVQWGEIAYLLCGACAVLLLIMVLARCRKDGSQAGASRKTDQYQHALKLLGIKGEDRRLLRRAAKASRLSDPISMLLSPMNLAHGATPLLENDRVGTTRRRLERLSRDLFDAPLPETSGSNQSRF